MGYDFNALTLTLCFHAALACKYNAFINIFYAI